MAKANLLALVQSLLKNGYTILDIKKMKLSDIDFIVKAMEQEEVEEEIETTLDVAFPFLFS